MKPSAIPVVVLLVLCLAFLGFLAWTSQQLPERVATHFGMHGEPNGWTPKPSAVMMTGGFGIGLPLLFVALSILLRFLPPELMNLPHREFWLAPERRNATYAFISRQLIWLSCMLVCFIAACNWLTVQANNSTPVRMPNDQFLIVLGTFLAALIVWIVNLVRQFRR
jgi:uncharacterized membrane protein